MEEETSSSFGEIGFWEGGGIEVEVGVGAEVRDDCGGMKTRGGIGDEFTIVRLTGLLILDDIYIVKGRPVGLLVKSEGGQEMFSSVELS